MKKIKVINEISQIRQINKQIFIQRKNGYIYKYDNNKLSLVLDKKTDVFTYYNNKLFFTVKNEINKIYYTSKNKNKVIIETSKDKSVNIGNDLLINSKLPISITPINDFIPCGMFLIDINDNVEKFNNYFRYEVKVNNIYFNRLKKEVIAFSETFEPIYKIDISNFGRNIAKDPKTGEILWNKPNEIKENLLADDKNIYVPLTGGQLLALDSQTGKKVWMFDNEKLGGYTIFKDKLYKSDGKSILAINNNGQVEKELFFKDISILKDYIPAGPFLAYEDVLISTDVYYGKICILNRYTLEVEEFFSLNKKLINSKNAIVWHNNKLYVLDIDNTLHIFEKEK